jgi:hypothetical protein
VPIIFKPDTGCSDGVRYMWMKGAEAYERRYREKHLRCLTASAAELGYELTPKPANA